MMPGSQASLGSHNSSTASLVYDKPFKTKGNNILGFDNYIMNLKPFEQQKVVINLRSLCPEKVNEYYEIMVKDGQSQFLKLISDIQQPHVSLNRVTMNLGRIYAGVTEYINPQSKH